MLMDNPQDWQDRMDSLKIAAAETAELMLPVLESHAINIASVFGVQDVPDADDNPFKVAQTKLVNQTPGAFLELAAENRPDAVPEALREFDKRDFYQLVKETLQLIYAVDLLLALAKFADEGFTFFKEGYYTKKNLPVSPDVPPRTIMRTLVNQVSFDVSVIQHAINQRRRQEDGQAMLQGCTLAMSDTLANWVMSVAVEAGYIPENTRVITYLAKSIRARLVPYSHALLISIPYSALHAGNQLSRINLAIPHEIGHHLYWNGVHTESNSSMRDHLLKKADEAGIKTGDWRLNWLEEIFADAHALALFGPAVVLDFQDMLDDDMSDHFREDTDKHPIPEIRPFIQTNILRRFTDETGLVLYDSECKKLDDNWSGWIKTHPLKASYPLIGQSQPMLGQAILDDLAPLITVVLDTLSDILPDEKYYTGMDGSNDLSALFTEFQSSELPDDDLELVNLFLAGDSTDEQTEAFLERDSEISFWEHVATVTSKKKEEIKTAEWMQLLRSHGWSSEGPMGDGGATTTGTGTGSGSNGTTKGGGST